MTDEDHTQAVPTAAVIAGRYRLDELVGRGGTAEVWRATDTQLERTVALKLVTGAHDESAARAADEAKTLARMSHPSLVQVYDAGTDSTGRPWVVMEFVDGKTLGQAIATAPLSVERVAEIGARVAEALDHVHSQGLVHRDIKPANVLLRRDGGVRLTDFGIARLVDAAKVTSTGLMVGTASYLAPEQVTGEPVGPPADVYGLGLVLLETLTGRREYAGPAVEAAMARLSRAPEIPTHLPDGWAPLLAAMTRREAAHRPTAGEVAAALRAMLNGEPTAMIASRTQAVPMAAPATSALPVQERPPVLTVPGPTRSSRTPIVVAGLVAALVLGAAGAVLATRGQTTPRPIPAISNDLPDQVRKPLGQLVARVQQ